LKLKPSTFEIINIKTPAVEKRKDAKKKGGSSVTATLLKTYVEPQITYIAKNAIIIKAFELNFGIV
jgi:hypothetical protein